MDKKTLRKQFFQKKIPEYRKDPVTFAIEVLKLQLDE
jgi:hypothetical protein